MALIKCPECDIDVSDTAKICPHCGCKVKNQKEKSKSMIIVILSIVIALIVIKIITGVIQQARDDKAVMLVSLIVEANHNIEEHKKLALSKTTNSKYVYNEEGMLEAIDEVSTDIFVICAHAEDLDSCYEKSRKAINEKLAEETNHNFFTWEEYREHLDSYCFFDDDTSSDIKAENLVKKYIDAMVH